MAAPPSVRACSSIFSAIVNNGGYSPALRTVKRASPSGAFPRQLREKRFPLAVGFCRFCLGLGFASPSASSVCSPRPLFVFACSPHNAVAFIPQSAKIPCGILRRGAASWRGLARSAMPAAVSPASARSRCSALRLSARARQAPLAPLPLLRASPLATVRALSPRRHARRAETVKNKSAVFAAARSGRSAPAGGGARKPRGVSSFLTVAARLLL